MNNQKKFDVIGLGACAVDFLGIVPSFPQPDTKNRMTEFIQQGGGPVATALVALARLGAKVSFVGKLGENELSRFVLDGFRKEGVDTSGVIREKDAGPYFAFIVVEKENGQRTIWWSDQMVRGLRKEELSGEFITSGKILHLDEYDLPSAIQAATWAKEAGVKVVLDAETPQRRELADLLKLVDFLVVPEEFALGFSRYESVEKAADFLLQTGPLAVVITQGIKGSFACTSDRSFRQDIFEVPVVDTTGCGDVFHGGFIYGLLKNWPLEITVEFATAVSALKCEKLGGRTGCPTFPKVKEFLQKRGSEEIKELL